MKKNSPRSSLAEEIFYAFEVRKIDFGWSVLL